MENKLIQEGYNSVIGIDEAGRGPLAGPVVACACVLKIEEKILLGHPMSKWIRDSKTLSEKRREKMYDFVIKHFHIGVGICDHKTVDRINILQATYLAMKKAINDLDNKINDKKIILVDGNKKIPNLSVRQVAIVNGDKKIKSISAASIIAKVTRDRIMREVHKKYPQYNFSKHKGYGTKIHLDALKKYGPCEIHRKSFAPVRLILGRK